MVSEFAKIPFVSTCIPMAEPPTTTVCGDTALISIFFNGKMPEEPIAVVADRDVQSLVSMFGVCAAGGWYVPMDNALPADRAALLLSVCSPAVL